MGQIFQPCIHLEFHIHLPSCWKISKWLTWIANSKALSTFLQSYFRLNYFLSKWNLFEAKCPNGNSKPFSLSTKCTFIIYWILNEVLGEPKMVCPSWNWARITNGQYPFALDFCKIPVWNIELDELDFFPSLNLILTACVITCSRHRNLQNIRIRILQIFVLILFNDSVTNNLRRVRKEY